MPKNAKVKSSSSVNNPVKRRIFEETIAILDSDDDFVIPNPIIRARRLVKEDTKKKPVTTISKATPSVSSRKTKGIEIVDEIIEIDNFVETYSSSDFEKDFDLAIKRTDETKDAWKGLMQRMQTNQKVTSSTSTFMKNVKTSGKTTKKPNRPVVTLPKFRPIDKAEESRINFKNSSLQTHEEDSLASSTASFLTVKKLTEPEGIISPPKKLKMEYSIQHQIADQSISPSSSSVHKMEHTFDSEASSINSSISTNAAHPNPKIPAMFLKPAERAALALTERLQKSKIVCDHESVLSQLSIEPTTFDSAKESAEYFDGNIVKLNDLVITEDPYGGTKTKVCPFYKKLPGTKFSVDAFNYGLIPGIEVYFLSHYHSDHYIGLTKKFCKTIICSPPTANLVRMKLSVEDKYIRRLQLNKQYIINGIEVILISANHCPGSVMFIFRLPNGTTYFHTGDFRFTTDMLDNHFVQGLRIDVLYLDTTYCDPKFDFPTQTDAISELITVVKRKLEFRPKTLILCGSYLIGKERVYFSLAEAIQSKVFGNYEKRRIINALENPLYTSYMADREELASIHVTQMFNINPKFLSEYLAAHLSQYNNIIGIKPSGWQFSSSGSGTTIKTHFNDTVTIIGVPYSEHSSYSELQHFVCATKPVKVQPTVNVGSTPKREAMLEHINKWQKCV